MSAALAAGVLSSCSKNEMVEILPQTENPNAIGLSTGIFASKSTETTTGGLHEEGKKLTFHSTDNGFGTNGVLQFTYTAGEWSANGATWENVDFTNSLSIFSMYDGNVANEGDVAVDPSTGVADEYTVESNVADQRDLIFFAQELFTIPTGGIITARYQHALSRVRMQDKTADFKDNLEVDCKMVNLKGFDGTAVATIGVDKSIAWSGNDDQTDASYAYDLPGADIKTNDMYIIPQLTAAHTAGDNVFEGVEVICMTKVNTTPIAGWESVEAFKNANPGVVSVKLVTDGTEYNGAMYIKAVFPISEETFAVGKYYNLLLNFAGASLQYVDDKFYDEDGNELEVEGEVITPQPETGDPVNPDPKGEIGLKVQVSEWPENTDQDIDTDKDASN